MKNQDNQDQPADQNPPQLPLNRRTTHAGIVAGAILALVLAWWLTPSRTTAQPGGGSPEPGENINCDVPYTNIIQCIPAMVVQTNVIIRPTAPAGAPYDSIVCAGAWVTDTLYQITLPMTNLWQLCHTCDGSRPTNWCDPITTSVGPWPVNVTNNWSYDWNFYNADQSWYQNGATNGLTTSSNPVVSLRYTNAATGTISFQNVSAAMPANPCGYTYPTVISGPSKTYAFVAVGNFWLDPYCGSPVYTNPPTYVYCAVPTNSPDRYITVSVSPVPYWIGDPYLPSGWHMTNGIPYTNQDHSISRTKVLVDRATPGTNTITAWSGVSSNTIKIIVERPILVPARSFVFVNSDHDNGSVTNDADLPLSGQGSTITNEDDLVGLTLGVQSPVRTNETVTLSVATSWGTHIRIWDSPQRGPRKPILDNWGDYYSYYVTNWPLNRMPTNLWIEGVSPSAWEEDVALTLQTEYYSSVSTNLTVTAALLDGDGDHDGYVAYNEPMKNQAPGVIVQCNVDDSNTNHVEDNRGLDATTIQGQADLADLAPIVLRQMIGLPLNSVVRLTLNSAANTSPDVGATNVVRIFSSNSDINAVPLLGPEGGTNFTLPTTSSSSHVDMPTLKSGNITLGVEGLDFAASVKLRLDVLGTNGTVLFSDNILLKVAPFILLPETAYAQEFYVSGADTNFVQGLRGALGPWRTVVTNLNIYADSLGVDVWSQDQVEIGYTHWPNQSELETIWNLPRVRGLVTWPTNELLAPSYGHFRYGTPQSGDGDSGGNLGVTPPVVAGGVTNKFGRIVVGSGMGADMTDFLARQGIQTNVIQVNTSWLEVGHVDEVVSFAPYGDKFKMLVADTTRAVSLLQGLDVEASSWATGGSDATLVDTAATWASDQWQGGFVTIISGQGAGQVRQVTGNSVNTVTVASSWTAPAANSGYQLVPRSAYRCLFIEGDEDLGVVSSAGITTLTDTTKNWTPDQWTNRGYVCIVEGQGATTTWRQILSNTPTNLTIAGGWPAGTPGATSRYVVGERSKLDGYGSPALRTVKQILGDNGLMNFNNQCQIDTDLVCANLTNELQLAQSDLIFIPALFNPHGLFHKAVAWVPGMVNLLIDGTTLVPAKPYGPHDSGGDIFEQDVRASLGQFGMSPNFLDDWDYYHNGQGEVHCGTNAKRTPSGLRWWE